MELECSLELGELNVIVPFSPSASTQAEGQHTHSLYSSLGEVLFFF